ncbi:MAG: hypothetical protein IPP86_18430 [Bacteroidetes bacterium]|nr:hypothetical protein [Bacteroidota bacterium]
MLQATIMMRHCLMTILTLLTWISIFAQTKINSCDCAKSQHDVTKADTTFHLSNGKTIALCGFKNEGSKPTNYSEFVLSVCGQDTIIDFWGAVMTCQLKVQKDTLLVEELQNLPTGNNFKYRNTIWATEKIYFSGQNVFRKNEVNRNLRKYTGDEIKIVLKEFETAKPGLDESKMELANKLFISAISGNKLARQYFIEFNNKFGTLDGAYSEEYYDLRAMLELWDKKE